MSIIWLEELLILYNSLFIENKTKHVFKNKLKIFLVKFKKIKLLLSDKSDIILYNKLYKILVELNKLIKNNDVNSFINLSLEEIKEKNLFMYLPFKLDVIFIFRKK